MAKRVNTQKKESTEQPTLHCSDCKHGVWVDTFQNKDWQGKPICLTCPYEQYHILRSRKACANFQPKPKDTKP